MKTTNPLSWHLVGRNEQCSGGRKWMKTSINRQHRRSFKQVVLGVSDDTLAPPEPSSAKVATIQYARRGWMHSIPATYQRNSYVDPAIFNDKLNDAVDDLFSDESWADELARLTEIEPEHTSCSLLTPLPYEVARQAIWGE